MRLKPTDQGCLNNPHLKVTEVTDDVSIFLLLSLVLHLKNSRDEVREAQQLSDNCISSGNDPEDGLTTQVVLCQEVHHGSWRRRRGGRTRGR